jgi:hypothetical protein
VIKGDGGGQVVECVEDDPVRPRGLVGAGGSQELREGLGEAVEGLKVELPLLVGEIITGLGAVRQALDDAWEREGHEVDARCRGRVQRREAGEVARRGDVGDAVAPRRQPLGEL